MICQLTQLFTSKIYTPFGTQLLLSWDPPNRTALLLSTSVNVQPEQGGGDSPTVSCRHHLPIYERYARSLHPSLACGMHPTTLDASKLNLQEC